MRAVVIVGQFFGFSQAQRREIKESLAELGVDLPCVVIEELRASIEAERAAPTRSEMAKKVVAVRESRQFDETDANMLAVFERNFSDRERRTPDRVRKCADKALRDLRQGKGNKPYYPRSDGIDSATKCALIVSVKLNWPSVTNRQAQTACEALYAAVGGNIKRRGGTPNRIDGFWRDHLREAQQLRDSVFSRCIESALVTCC